MEIYDRWLHYDDEKEKALAKRPVCSVCDDPIQDEHLYLINDELVCPECLDRNFRKYTDDYVS